MSASAQARGRVRAREHERRPAAHGRQRRHVRARSPARAGRPCAVCGGVGGVVSGPSPGDALSGAAGPANA
jgi:hypothetical protein